MMKDELSMDSTIGEIMGILRFDEGVPSNPRILGLLRLILKGLVPDERWFIDRSILNDRVDISLANAYELRGMSLLLNTDEDVGLLIHYIVLTLTHQRERHKGLSIGSITINPDKWYLPLVDQQRHLREHPELVDKIYEQTKILNQMN